MAPIAEESPEEAVEEPKEPKEEPKRMGRPVGAKDSKPRKKKPEEVVEKRVDPVYDYHEVKRQAVERAYRAQAEHWENLLSHLM